MKNLVVEYKGIPSVSHLVVAENTSNETRSVSKIITNYLKDFEEFGAVRFEIATEHLGLLEPSANKFLANQARKIYWLNEEQATLLLTYLQNTPIVRDFKKALIKEFYQIKKHFAIGKEQFNQVLSALSEKSAQADNAKLEILTLKDELIFTQRKLIERLEKTDIGKTQTLKKSTRLSSAEKDEIVKLYKSGLSQSEICRQTNRSDTAVRNAIRSAL